MNAKILAIGGGLASFAVVDALRSNGVSKGDIRVIGEYAKPYGKFKERCENSGIAPNDRLRSDSSATPGNIWGWPTFGMREVITLAKHGHLLKSSKLIARLFTEPIFGDVYTPKLSHVTEAIDRECSRIGYENMLLIGSVVKVTKVSGGWQATYLDEQGREQVITAEFIHVATGFQGNKHSQDHEHLVSKFGRLYSHVYDKHEHLYKLAEAEGGTVVLRGRGIAASRVLERLLKISEKQPKLKVLHLMNSKLTGEGAPIRINRRTQSFNFPKDAFGGHKAERYMKLERDDRKDFIDSFGQTTTPMRKHWTKLMSQATKRGQYSIQVGTIAADENRIFVDPKGVGAAIRDIVGFIDATGLIRDPQNTDLFRSLASTGDVVFDGNGFLKVSERFELTNSNHSKSNIFAGGNLALGGPYSPVDSFSGINLNGHIVAHEIIRRLTNSKDVRKPIIDSPVASAAAWLRWARGVAP